MKRRCLSLLFVLVLCFVFILPTAASAAEDYPRLIDNAEVLNDSNYEEILKELDRISEKYEADVVIVTVTSTDGDPIEDFTESLYGDFGFGQGDDRDGIILLIDMGESEYCFFCDGFCYDAFTESNLDQVENAVVSELEDDAFKEAFLAYTEKCEYYLNGHINGFPFRFGLNLIVCLILGLVVALIATGVMRGKLKSVRKEYTANRYTVPGSMHISVSRDLFLYRNVTRVKKAQNNSNGSGSGTRTRSGKF